MSYQKTATKCSLKARKLELIMKTNELKFRQCGEQRNKDNASNHYEMTYQKRQWEHVKERIES